MPSFLDCFITYIVDNKEWLFSGIGVIAAVALLKILIRIRRGIRWSDVSQTIVGNNNVQIGIQNNFSQLGDEK